MAASVHEAILARIKEALLGATDAGERVYRGRAKPHAPDETPAIDVRRAPSQSAPFAQGADQAVMEFSLDFIASGDDWETHADALHMQAHDVLAADAQLATLGAGLRCTRTDPQPDLADVTVGRITATYQMQVIVSTQDLTRKLR